MSKHPKFKPVKMYKAHLNETIDKIADHSMKLAVYIRIHHLLFENEGLDIMRKRKKQLKKMTKPVFLKSNFSKIQDDEAYLGV